jgi:DNA-binding transcriptional MerR regulator
MKKKQPPSKLRYDAEHPTVSFRVTNEFKGRLDEVVRRKGLSYADFIREILEHKETREEEAYAQGYRKGYDSRQDELEELQRHLQSSNSRIAHLQQEIARLQRTSVQSLFIYLKPEQRELLRDWMKQKQLERIMEKLIQEGV